MKKVHGGNTNFPRDKQSSATELEDLQIPVKKGQRKKYCWLK